MLTGVRSHLPTLQTDHPREPGVTHPSDAKGAGTSDIALPAKPLTPALQVDRYTLLERMPLAIVALDGTDELAVIRVVNESAAALYGREAGDLRGRTLQVLYEPHAAACHRRLLHRAHRDGSATIETVHVNARGARVAVRVHAWLDGQPEAASVMLTVEDIADEVDRRSMVDAIDEDRLRMAHELHDTVAQSLAGIRMEIATWRDLLSSDPEYVVAAMDDVLQDLAEEIAHTRQAIFAQRPVELDEQGFAHTVRRLLADMQAQYGFQVEWIESCPDTEPAADLALPLLRILQEALNNVGKHAAASHVQVSIVCADATLRLSVEDDGQGFDPRAISAPSSTSSYGLLQMRERVRGIGGRIDIDSAPGRGTRLSVFVSDRA